MWNAIAIVATTFLVTIMSQSLSMQDIPEDVTSPPKSDGKDDKTTGTDVVSYEFPSVPSWSGNETPDATDYTKFVSDGKDLQASAQLDQHGMISVYYRRMQVETTDFLHGKQDEVEEYAVDKVGWQNVPAMNVVIMIVGSRGDVQPYVALGKSLVQDGHRVRIATHATFQSFVTDAGLEFYSIGGNPKDLLSYMVKNPGLIPGIESLTNGDVSKKREMLHEMIHGCWQSCHSPDPVSKRTFTADAIISNPPAFAHTHCAEALGIPLLLSFTMPWTPTASFPQPLVNISDSNVSFGLSNYLSYSAADILTWKGVGDIINSFRTTVLGLAPLSLRSGPGRVERLKIPWTYCMSPALVPKPDDWQTHIDVVGFYFLDLASTYQPPSELEAFLEGGDTPIYIGFGSVVVDDPAAMSQIIFDAIESAGVRALVSVGWGGLGGVSVPSNVFMLDNVPHDWLFDKDRVSVVVHHGGAGTTAIGLAKGRPTVVVPFFGDQGFWGSMIHKAGAGPAPIRPKDLTAAKLADAINFALNPSVALAASQMALKIKSENGVKKGIESFYRHLPLLNMRCDLDPSRVAVWWSVEHCLKLSAFAAQTLADAHLLTMSSLVLHRPKEHLPHRTKEVTPSEVPPSPKSPNEGHKKDGVLKAIKGTAKNLVYEKLGFITIPLMNVWKAERSESAKAQAQQQSLNRLQDGRDAVNASTVEQRKAIIAKFKLAIVHTLQRRKTYEEAINHALEAGLNVDLEQVNDGKSAPLGLPSQVVVEEPVPDLPESVAKEGPGTETLVDSPPAEQQVINFDDMYQKDLELAIRLSLDESKRESEQ